LLRLSRPCSKRRATLRHHPISAAGGLLTCRRRKPALQPVRAFQGCRRYSLGAILVSRRKT